MANSSATGGYLTAPNSSLNVEHFFHDLIVGLTGFDNKLVRPRWQSNTPIIPNIEVDWVAFGVTNETADDSAYVDENNLIRHQELEIMCSFYGLNAVQNANNFRDCFQIGQNRETMFSNGFGFVGVSNIVRAPELLNERWFNRADITITVRQELKKDFNILTIESIGDGTVHVPSGNFIDAEIIKIPILVKE